MGDAIMLVASTSFTARVGGQDYAVHAGNTIMSDHPLAMEHPDMFRPAIDRVTFPSPKKARVADAPVEQATKEPGTKRNR